MNPYHKAKAPKPRIVPGDAQDVATGMDARSRSLMGKKAHEKLSSQIRREGLQKKK